MKSMNLLNISEEELSQIVEHAVRKVMRESDLTVQNETQTLIDRKEAIKLLNISKSTMYIWMRDNKIRYRKKGKRIFFIKEELLEDLERHNERRVG